MSDDGKLQVGTVSSGKTISIGAVPSPPMEKRIETIMVVVNKTYKDHRIIIDQSEEVLDTIRVKLPPEGVPLAKVRASSQMTINMGDFESVQLHVAVELPCVVEEIDDCFNAALQFVDSRLSAQTAAVRTYRDTVKNKKSKPEPPTTTAQY